MKDYIIVVPSYKRANLCITQKIASDAKIIVPESQLSAYRANGLNAFSIPDNLDGNIAKKRNAILNMFPDQNIVMLDDDIEFFTMLKNGKLKSLSPEETQNLFQRIFSAMDKMNADLGGVYPVNNAFYMEHRINPKGFIIGSCMCFRKGFSDRFSEEIMAKEDYEMLVQQLKKGKCVARLNGFSHKKKEYIGQGGVAQQRTEGDIDREATKFLIERYPQYLRKNPKRENEILVR